jgi:hypothetical protein
LRGEREKDKGEFVEAIKRHMAAGTGGSALKDMTDTNLTYEEQQQAKAKREKEKRKRQAELDEAMLIGFMTGNMGSVYMMDAAAQTASE